MKRHETLLNNVSCALSMRVTGVYAVFKWLLRWKAPSADEIQLLRALYSGWTLKSHRYLDGGKVYRLHSLNGEEITPPDSTVEALIRRRWIHSNQKFPAATLLLTDTGRAALTQMGHAEAVPLGARQFFKSER